MPKDRRLELTETELYEMVRDDPRHTSFPPATEEEIRQTEASLGNPLPEDYRSFLGASDGSLIDQTLIVLGVKSHAEIGAESIAQANDQRPAGNLTLFAHNGSYYGFGSEGEVMTWTSDAPNNTQTVTPDFRTFLADRLEVKVKETPTNSNP